MDSTRARPPIALVTGASRGIGKATALELAAAGHTVIVTARTLRDGTARLDDGSDVVVPGGLDTTVAAIEAIGGTACALPMDLLDPSSIDDALTSTLARFGGVDVLVNNAIYQGPGTLDRLADLGEADLRRAVEGNFFAQVGIVQRLLPMLVGTRGTIVNLVSGAAFQDPPAPVGSGGWGLAYAASKAAFARLTPILHAEHGGDGLRVFSVDPGLTVTERMEAAGRAEQYRKHFAAATPDVIARAIRWLVTDPGADALRGTVVHAQHEVASRGLLAAWPPAEAASADRV